MGTSTAKIEDLFESALRDFWSSDVCSDYIQWVMRADSELGFVQIKEVRYLRLRAPVKPNFLEV